MSLKKRGRTVLSHHNHYCVTSLKALDNIGNYSKIIVSIETYLVMSNGELLSYFIINLQLIEPKLLQVYYCMHMLVYTKWEYWSLTITCPVPLTSYAFCFLRVRSRTRVNVLDRKLKQNKNKKGKKAVACKFNDRQPWL